MLELSEILRDERIDRRNVRGGNSGVLACEHQDQMFEIILEKNRDRSFSRESAVEECVGDTSYG